MHNKLFSPFLFVLPCGVLIITPFYLAYIDLSFLDVISMGQDARPSCPQLYSHYLGPGLELTLTKPLK